MDTREKDLAMLVRENAHEEASMAEFIFTPVNYADGIPFYYAKNACDQRLYRLEPVATRLRWGEAGNFRCKVAARKDLDGKEGASGGILFVVGPVTYQGQRLIGWEARPGRPLFPDLPTTLSLEERLTALEPLLRSYHSYHRQGLIVGCPDWRRVNLGPAGIDMPDPLLLSYLHRPKRPLPKGLAACQPPESYQDQPLSPKGDLFYFGVLAYLVLTGELPYLLVRGWPTVALQEGLIIPPTRWQPDLPTDLAWSLERLLAVEPQKRPDAEDLIQVWREVKTRRFPVGRRKKKKATLRGLRGRLFWRLYRRQCGLATLALIVILFFCAWGLSRRTSGVDRVLLRSEDLTVLLQEVADPNFPDEWLPGGREVWTDLLMAKEERRALAAALLTHPLVQVEKVTALWQEENYAQFEVDLVWYHWRDYRWQTTYAREKIKMVRSGSHWEIVERQRLP